MAVINKDCYLCGLSAPAMCEYYSFKLSGKVSGWIVAPIMRSDKADENGVDVVMCGYDLQCDYKTKAKISIEVEDRFLGVKYLDYLGLRKEGSTGK